MQFRPGEDNSRVGAAKNAGRAVRKAHHNRTLIHILGMFVAATLVMNILIVSWYYGLTKPTEAVMDLKVTVELLELRLDRIERDGTE